MKRDFKGIVVIYKEVLEGVEYDGTSKDDHFQWTLLRRACILLFSSKCSIQHSGCLFSPLKPYTAL